MQKCVTTARRTAWYKEEDLPCPDYNPFRKIHRPPKKPGDEEDTTVPTYNSDVRLSESRLAVPKGPGNGETITMPSSTKSASRDSVTPSVQHFSHEKEKGYYSDDTECETDIIPNDTKCETDIIRKDRRQKSRRRKFPSLEKPKRMQKFSAAGQLKASILNAWTNILLLTAPIGIALHYAFRHHPSQAQSLAIFIINAIALIPLADLMSFGLEDGKLRVGETLGTLLEVSLANAPRIMVAMLTLFRHSSTLAQSFLIGTMLQAILLVLGLCFFFGGFNRHEQYFNITIVHNQSSFLLMATAIMLAGMVFLQDSNFSGLGAKLSHATEVILLIVYLCYLFFQLKSHAWMYNAPSPRARKRRTKVTDRDSIAAFARMGGGISASMGNSVPHETPMSESDEYLPYLSKWVMTLTICICIGLIGLCSMSVIDSIADVTKYYSISERFIGLVLLPLTIHLSEYATAISTGCKDEQDLAIAMVMHISSETILLIAPLVVTTSWIADSQKKIEDPLTLNFEASYATALFAAVLLVNYLIQDGKSYWLQGCFLVALYLVIAVASWF